MPTRLAKSRSVRFNSTFIYAVEMLLTSGCVKVWFPMVLPSR